jgi:hypothetical protein
VIVLTPDQNPPVDSGELLARAIVASRWFRRSDNTVKQDAFMPHPYIELSMTRHLQATEEELWADCGRVADLQQKTLHGRADVKATAFVEQGLRVEAAPLPENPNHVNATGWPTEKSAQKLMAIEIAKQARFLPTPHAP